MLNKIVSNHKRISIHRPEQEAFIKEAGLVPATKEDYLQWLKGYLEKGGKPSHFYDRSIEKYDIERFYIATKDFKMQPLFGAELIKIIIPAEIQALGDNIGHNTIYDFKDFIFNKYRDVPIFNDACFKQLLSSYDSKVKIESSKNLRSENAEPSAVDRLQAIVRRLEYGGIFKMSQATITQTLDSIYDYIQTEAPELYKKYSEEFRNDYIDSLIEFPDAVATRMIEQNGQLKELSMSVREWVCNFLKYSIEILQNDINAENKLLENKLSPEEITNNHKLIKENLEKMAFTVGEEFDDPKTSSNGETVVIQVKAIGGRVWIFDKKAHAIVIIDPPMSSRLLDLSPDGKHLMFVSYDERSEFWDYSIEETQLMNCQPQEDFLTPIFSPDSEYCAFELMKDRGRYYIYSFSEQRLFSLEESEEFISKNNIVNWSK